MCLVAPMSTTQSVMLLTKFISKTSATLDFKTILGTSYILSINKNKKSLLKIVESIVWKIVQID